MVEKVKQIFNRPMLPLAREMLRDAFASFDWRDTKPSHFPGPGISPPLISFVFNRDGNRYFLNLLELKGEVLSPADVIGDLPKKRPMKKKDYLFVKNILLNELDGFHKKEFMKSENKLDKKFS